MAGMIRLLRGDWFITAYGRWEFRNHPTDLGYGANISETETLEGLMNHVRRRYFIAPTTPLALTYRVPDLMPEPFRNSGPPSNITTDADVSAFMAIRYCYPTITMCVTYGAQPVATYQFNCRTPFTVGRHTYLQPTNSYEEYQSTLQEYNDLVTGRSIVGVQRVLEVIFTEFEMLALHRVHLETLYSNPLDHVRQIPTMLVPAISQAPTATSTMVTAEGPSIALSQPRVWRDNQNGETRLEPVPISVIYPPPIGQTSHMSSRFGAGVSDSLLNYANRTGRIDYGWIEESQFFWTGAFSGSYGQPQNMSQNERTEVEDEDMTDVQGTLSPTNNTVVLSSESDDTSSTGSSGEICLIADFEAEHNVALLPSEAEPQLAPTSETNVTGHEIAGQDTFPPSEPTNLEGEITPVTRSIETAEADLGLSLGCGGSSTQGGSLAESNEGGSSSEGSRTVGELANNIKDLDVGMIFKNREAFKQHMALHAIHHKFRFRHHRSSPAKMVLTCYGNTCNWRVYAVRLYNSEMYEIRSLEHNHTCTIDDRGGFQRQATTSVIGELVRSKFGGSSKGPSPRDIRNIMRGDHNVRISYWKAWRSREVAMNATTGTTEQSYLSLPKYLHKLVMANPGTIMSLETTTIEGFGEKFKYLFFSLGASIKGYAYMRKVIILDGTHLKGKYSGCLLSATTQDSNYQIFPLATAVVDSENDKAWTWFFQKLSLFIPNEEGLVFVSDRHASIYAGLNEVYKDAYHGACLVHLKRNVKDNYRGSYLGKLVSKSARAYTLSEFYKHFSQIEIMHPGCAEYLTNIGFEHWTRSQFEGKRYDIMTTNVAESWNAVLKEARELPIQTLVEYIRSKLMSWFAKRRDESSKSTESLPPKILQILVENFNQSTNYEVNKIQAGEFAIQDEDGKNFHVNINEKTCSCYAFQKLEIPCSHAVAVAVCENIRMDTLVGIEYTTETWKKAYANPINPPVDVEDQHQVPTAITSLQLYPPSARRPPGRPRKKRFLSRAEKIAQKMKRRSTCSRCKR